MKIVIVGVGALGSHLVQCLRGFEGLTVIDFDRVEQKNCLSQFHSVQSVGKNKTAALQQTMKFLWKTDLKVVPHRLTEDNVKQLLGGAGLVIDCLDNAPSRTIIQEYVRAQSIPCLHGALSADGTLGRVVWDADFAIDAGATGAATCEDGQHLPFIVMVSAALARSAQEFVKTGRKIGWQVYPNSGSTRI